MCEESNSRRDDVGFCDVWKAGRAGLYVLSGVETQGHCERRKLATVTEASCGVVRKPYSNGLQFEAQLWETVQELESFEMLELMKVDERDSQPDLTETFFGMVSLFLGCRWRCYRQRES